MQKRCGFSGRGTGGLTRPPISIRCCWQRSSRSSTFSRRYTTAWRKMRRRNRKKLQMQGLRLLRSERNAAEGLFSDSSFFFGDPDDLQHPCHLLDFPGVEGVGVSDHADNDPVNAGGLVNIEVPVDQELLDMRSEERRV